MLRLPGPDPTVVELADWAELATIFSTAGSLGRAEIADVLGDELGVDDLEDFALGLGVEDELDDEEEAELRGDRHRAVGEGVTASQEQTDAVLRELDFRAQFVGTSYPLSVDGEGVLRRWPWAARPLYPFLSLLGARVLYGLEIPFHVPARLFEEVTAHAVGYYVGGEAVRFGWPRLEDEPVEDFKSKVRSLARRMGEDVGQMRNIGPHAKDYDLDVIAWRAFRDGATPGQLVVVCQCAIGTDWAEKILSVDSWSEVINFNVKPVGALAFPLVPSREPEVLYRWHDVTSHGSLPLDRLRLGGLLDEDRIPAPLIERVRAWVEENVGALPESA